MDMFLKKLSLIGFRNHLNTNIEFESGLTLILGRNGAGKTNVLETINLLSSGDTFREGKIEEMVSFDSEVAHVGGVVRNLKNQKSEIKVKESTGVDDYDETQLRVTLTRGVLGGKRVSKRRFLVNDVGKSKRNFVGNLRSVAFRPEDMRLVEGSPSRRRKFLDEVLCQVDRNYLSSLMTYGKGLVRRNKTLQMIRDGETSRSALEYWDRLVLKHGEYVQKGRFKLVDFFNECKEYEDFGLRMEYDHSIMSPARLEQYAVQEVGAGHTLVGPHRDDIRLIVGNSKFKNSNSKLSGLRRIGGELDLAAYGSRGEQRLGVLWLKLMALEFVEEVTGERPLLLLDDVYSELDDEHRELVSGVVDRQQTIVTSADRQNVETLIESAQILELANGGLVG